MDMQHQKYAQGTFNFQPQILHMDAVFPPNTKQIIFFTPEWIPMFFQNKFLPEILA